MASVGVATDKARTAAIYRRPSKDFEDQASSGRASALHLARAVPLQGRIPIVRDDRVIGAVGVSGASSADEDHELALLGAAALAPNNGSSNGGTFSDGTLVFTDPPFGLPGTFDDPDKELPFSGVFAVRDGRVTLVTDELEGPNGIAFSLDERHLYVGNWDPERKLVMRYELGSDLDVIDAAVLFDMTSSAGGEDAIDGLKVDVDGNVYACGPGGIWVISPAGDHLGTLRLPKAPHNLAWSDGDGRTLYVAALTSVYRIRLQIPGIRPH